MAKGLGKGLSALISENKSLQGKPAAAPKLASSNDAIVALPLDSIKPGKLQPRTVFDEEALAELAESIQKNGVIQPIVVRYQCRKTFS